MMDALTLVFAPLDASMGVEALGQVMPMFLWLSDAGLIRAVGPTLQKVVATPLVGQRFFDAFHVKRPCAATPADFLASPGLRLRMTARALPHRSLRGVAVPLAAGQGILLNLSFGIAVADAVREHNLTDADFAATDLAIEMLYLIEAKGAVAEENRALTRRLQGARDVAEAEAMTDTLTGLGNRRALDRALAASIAFSQPFALLHIDLDFFKTVNDTWGHATGDHVLCRIARILQANTRDTDCVARVGGDEFVVILQGLGHPSRLTPVAERILSAARQPIDWEGRVCRVSLSIGAVVSTAYANPKAAQLLQDADAALYASKRAGRATLTLG